MCDNIPELKDASAFSPEWTNSDIKPLYMLIKVEIDKDYITNQQHADEFAEDFGVMHECKIVDTYYPDDEQYPYIAK